MASDGAFARPDSPACAFDSTPLLHFAFRTPDMPRTLNANNGLWSRLRNRHPLAGLLSASALEQVFQQERARADRSGKCFSMVVFLPSDGSTADMGALIRILKERMRIYDSLGQLDPRRVALLMPEADSRGAWTLADNVIQLCLQEGLAFQCEVYSYPIDWTREGSPSSDSGVRRHPLRITKDEDEATPAAGREVPAARAEGSAGVAAAPERTGTTDSALAVGLVERVKQSRPVFDLGPLFVQPLPPGRRTVDVLVSSLALVLLSPLFLVVAALIKVTTPGPIIFRQQRAGLGGRPFTFYKFRSMYVDAEARLASVKGRNIHRTGPIFKDPDDPRITPVGRFLRRASIDELPQIFNVLRGDMTLIGPRPPKLDEVEKYQPWQRRRLEVMGGLTCIWQVSGRSEVGFDEWVRMDIQYQRKQSLLFDVKLLFKTVGAVISGRGAY